MNPSFFLRAFALAGAAALFAIDPALAQDAAAPAAEAAAPALDTGDTAWMLTSTALVLMMTIPGLALFYGGMVRKKNVLGVVMQSFAICCLASIIWMVIGYSMVFAPNGSEALQPYVGGMGAMFFSGVTMESTNALAGTIPEWVFIMFQMTFFIITPALITGAFAERMKFSAVLLFTALWLVLVYAPVAHWVWGGGWLGSDGVLDFAGGTVVHINAGVAGLVIAIMLGKRSGYGQVNMAPHNLTLTMIGASLLWVGWFGFNAGSAASSGALAGVAMLNTQIATAAAALAWMFVEWVVIKKPSVLGILSGAIGGLVAITPAAGFVNPTGALIIGLVSGVGCYIAAVHIKKALGYDDSLDVFGVHGVGGIIGAILTGVFADPAINSLAEGASVGAQVMGVVVTIIYTAIASAVILLVVKAITGIRVTKSEEEEGLDLALHGESVH
ncbi:ammonium transporter [Agaricicola taiwanensis]|uniref:Ammonium transporter n=1 Tax=Agaricicola taiwanensis TaxID=591372 RepID=A0A8J2YA94_9RHOB|nr:ammonium transporter [Agaricicola taiwanensis]GGE28674.1 ammonium transporter [Agaricicola taiwanensis]